jgi:hypothetical protein
MSATAFVNRKKKAAGRLALRRNQSVHQCRGDPRLIAEHKQYGSGRTGQCTDSAPHGLEHFTVGVRVCHPMDRPPIQGAFDRTPVRASDNQDFPDAALEKFIDDPGDGGAIANGQKQLLPAHPS